MWEYFAMAISGIGLRVKNFNECGFCFCKEPDGGLQLLHDSRRGQPVAAEEVGFTHEGQDLLLREAEVFLNQHTHVEYVLLVNTIARNSRVESIRFTLCSRHRIQAQKTRQRLFRKPNPPCKREEGLKFGSKKRI